MASTITAGNATNNGTSISSDNTGILEIKTGTGSGTTAMTLNASANVGIGTASPVVPLDIYNATTSSLRVQGDSTVNAQLARYSTDNQPAVAIIRKGRGTVASPSAVASGDIMGSITFQAYGGTNNRSLAAITGVVSAYTSDTDISSFLNFSTTPTGSVTAAERMRIDSAGNVGIGTSSPTTQLDLTRTVTGGAGLSFQANNPDTGASSASYVLAKQGSVSTGIYSYGNSGSYIGAITNNFAAFITNNTERMRIDTAGNVGIGTNAPAGILDVKGNTNGVIAQYLRNDSTGASSTSVYQISAGTRYVNQNVNYTGQFYQVIGSGIVLSYSDFDTQIWRNNAGTERMRIDSSGNLLVGTTSGVAKVVVQSPNAATAIVTGNTSGTALYNAALFYNNGLASLVGQIAVSGTTCSYNSLSDYRLKEDVQPMTGALEKVAALKPCTYTWKADGSAGQGFIAHELQAVVPDCVVGEKDAINEDGSIKPQGIDTSFLVATLTAALQELKAELDVCKAELDALKGAK
jgi:trimeric autotransporter adhesin